MSDGGIVDAHVHVFLPVPDDPDRTVDVLAPPEREAPLDALEREMADAGVDGAVLVPLGPEDRYVSECIASDPTRFAGIAVAAADEDPGRVAQRLDVGRFSGLRMFGLPGDPTDRPPWLGVLERLAADGHVLWLYPRAEHLPTVDAVAARLPDLRVVLNHSGFTQAGIGRDQYGRPRIDSPVPQPHEAQVLDLSRHPNVSVIVSGAYGFSRLEYPYPDVAEVVRRVADAFGLDRLAWASDFPWIVVHPGYRACVELVDHHLPGLAPAERSAVLGGNIRRILRWDDQRSATPAAG
jgi:predicted TIM-barrel fold metal-dependent hydrolase